MAEKFLRSVEKKNKKKSGSSSEQSSLNYNHDTVTNFSQMKISKETQPEENPSTSVSSSSTPSSGLLKLYEIHPRVSNSVAQRSNDMNNSIDDEYKHQNTNGTNQISYSPQFPVLNLSPESLDLSDYYFDRERYSDGEVGEVLSLGEVRIDSAKSSDISDEENDF